MFFLIMLMIISSMPPPARKVIQRGSKGLSKMSHLSISSGPRVNPDRPPAALTFTS
jgi:hypothetical protein